ncbi:hypothetical protein [Carboxylicivirga marina]|uniref:Uncharacterized protein n=1 Tax=Carboxylicivirga marina TaxID=2800988 RepID=A0ABS1HNT1_9BACT|nr:hypothetical protein [Carboxylicivirga marina]MBK3519348.1 hypothetical protein [Carboxylicivirga marina]
MNEINGNTKLDQVLKKYSGNISILEEAIDVKLQAEYFKESKKQKQELIKADVLSKKEQLFEASVCVEQKKELLCQLASIDDVEAYRTLEKYKQEAAIELTDWSILAFQESKMLIQSALLDEKPLFISTGLGGRGHLLRYFIVLFTHDYQAFSEYQGELIKSEVDYTFKKVAAELEDLTIKGCYVTISALVPIEIPLKKVLSGIVKQCNEIGNFLNPSVLVTNVKKLSANDIEGLVNKNKKKSSK